MNWKTGLALLLLLLAGCDSPPPTPPPPEPQMYVFRLVRPDGTIHKEIKAIAGSPWVASSNWGQRVHTWGGPRLNLPDAPIGWLWEIEPVAEKEDK